MKNLIYTLALLITFSSYSQDILLNGTVSTENNQIKNIANPTDEQDAVTKNYLDSNISEISENYQSLTFSNYIERPEGILFSLVGTGVASPNEDWGNENIFLYPTQQFSTSGWLAVNNWDNLSNIHWVDNSSGVLSMQNSYYYDYNFNASIEVVDLPEYSRTYTNINCKNLEFSFIDLAANRYAQIKIEVFDENGEIINSKFLFERNASNVNDATIEVNIPNKLYSEGTSFYFYNYGTSTLYNTLIKLNASETISQLVVTFKRSSNGSYYANWTGQLWISKH